MKSLLQNTNSGVFSDLLTKPEPVELLKSSLSTEWKQNLPKLRQHRVFTVFPAKLLRSLLHDLDHVHVYVQVLG